MRLAEVDWTVLRRAIVALGIALAVGGMLLGGSYWFGTTGEQQYQQQRRKLMDTRRRFLSIDEEKRVIDAYYPRFQELEEAGIIEREFRLNWLEALRDSVAVVKLPSLRYEIASRESFTPDFPIETGLYRVYVSRMRITAGLLHEGDLLALLHELELNARGMFTVGGCTLRRLNELFESDPTNANLDADCELQWLTVRRQTDEERGF